MKALAQDRYGTADTEVPRRRTPRAGEGQVPVHVVAAGMEDFLAVVLLTGANLLG